MARIAVCVYTFAACSLLLVGCQTGRKQAANPFDPPASVARRGTDETSPLDADRDGRSPAAPLDDEAVANSEAADGRTGDPELHLTDEDLAHLPEEERRRIRRNVAAMDPASAKIVVRTIRGSSDLARASARGGNAADRAGLGGGHSLGHRGSGTSLAGTGGDSRNPVALEGIGEASAWNDTARGDGPGGTRTAFRQSSERWPAPEPEPAPTGTFDRLTGRLTGILPAAASNATPSNVVTGDATAAVAPRRPRLAPLGFGTPPTAAPVSSTDIPLDRTMGGSFEMVPPPRTRQGDESTIATSDGPTPLEQLIDQLERDVTDAEPEDDPAARLAYVERHVFLRLMYIAAGDDRAFTAIPGLSPDEQTFWTNYLFATANYLDIEGIPEARDRAGQTVSQLRSAIVALQAEARLELRNVGCCQSIASFGNYTPREKTDFRPGTEVLIYAEVENFRSETTADGDYRTLLTSKVEFYRADGTLASKEIDFGKSEDRCRNHRRDYFLSFKFQLPADLAPGAQTMKLIVTDELSGRTDTISLNYTIVP